MAFGSNQQAKRETVFLDLKSNATIAGGVCFRQTLSKTANPDTTPGAKKNIYTYAAHQFVEGQFSGFSIKEEPTYDNPEIKEMIGYVSVADTNGGPTAVIKFPVLSQFGRTMVGLINGVIAQGEPSVYLLASQAAAGDKIGDRVLDKPQAYLTARTPGVGGARVVPLYCDSDGNPLLDDKGVPQKLPMGVEVQVSRNKTMWNHEAADDCALNTATAILAHFEAMHQTQNHGAAPAEGGIDLDEAAAAAAPQA